jgi:hypothetical protein
MSYQILLFYRSEADCIVSTHNGKTGEVSYIKQNMAFCCGPLATRLRLVHAVGEQLDLCQIDQIDYPHVSSG